MPAVTVTAGTLLHRREDIGIAEALQTAGHDVEFYVRPRRAAEYGDDVGIYLIDARRAPLGRQVHHAVPIRLRESVEPRDGFDLVVLSVAHHRLATAVAFLPPRIGDATVLVLGNVWEEPLAAIAPLPAAQIMFGFPHAGGVLRGRRRPARRAVPPVILGTSGTDPRARKWSDGRVPSPRLGKVLHRSEAVGTARLPEVRQFRSSDVRMIRRWSHGG